MKIIGNDDEFSPEKVEFVIKTKSKTFYVRSNYIHFNSFEKHILIRLRSQQRLIVLQKLL